MGRCRGSRFRKTSAFCFKPLEFGLTEALLLPWSEPKRTREVNRGSCDLWRLRVQPLPGADMNGYWRVARPKAGCVSSGSCLKWVWSRSSFTCLGWEPSRWAGWGRLSLPRASACWSAWWPPDSSAVPGSWSAGRHHSMETKGQKVTPTPFKHYGVQNKQIRSSQKRQCALYINLFVCSRTTCIIAATTLESIGAE